MVSTESATTDFLLRNRFVFYFFVVPPIYLFLLFFVQAVDGTRKFHRALPLRVTLRVTATLTPCSFDLIGAADRGVHHPLLRRSLLLAVDIRQGSLLFYCSP